MAVQRFDLRPNRQLLDNDFNGYKLSLDQLSTYSIKISDLHEIKLGEEQYSFQHIKSFSLHNHLHQDHWNLDHVYYIGEDFSVRHVTIKEFQLTEPRNVFKIPQKLPRTSGHWNVTLQFISPDYVILADGTGYLYLIQAVDRSSSNEWKLLFSTDECASKKPFILVHSVMRNPSIIECLLMHIDERSVVEGLQDADEKLPFALVLEWITLSINVENNWTLTRSRRIAACGSIDYAALESNGSGIYIVSEKPFQFIFDSLKPVNLNLKAKRESSVKDNTPLYVWTQTSEEITVWIKFAKKVSKTELDIKILSSRLHVGLKSGSVLIEGALFSNIDADSSTWTWQDNMLEITLNKINRGLIWQELLKGDDQGQEALDASVASQIKEQLAHLSSENPASQKKPFETFNPQQLEECDDFPVNSYNLMRMDGETHQLTHEVSLSSHQWIFSVVKFPNEVPAICVRHDVDGLLWQPFGLVSDANPSLKCEHIATFNALGYVMASKQEKKFLSCSPECTFAVLCDVRLHLYLYFQPTDVASELRNRKTGQRVRTMAKQQLVTLDSSEVLGLQVSNDNVFILTRESLFAVRVFER